jgi:hypothetical protein
VSRFVLNTQLPIAAFVLLVLICGLGCKRRVEQPPLAATSDTPDRLEPGEPMVGTPRVFGLDVPDGLRVVATYYKSVHLSGPLPVPATVEALQRQLEPTVMEFTPTRAVWERVFAKNDTSRTLMRIEITREGSTTRVHVADITPTKAPEGLSEAERWERAGRNPDGTLKNPSEML